MKKQRSPTSVMPPPSSVPVFIVTLSRISHSAPIDKPRRPAAILHRLRRRAERGERINDRARADRGMTGDMHMRDEPAAVADLDMRADRRNRARSIDVCADHRARVDPGGRIDCRHRITPHATMAPTSASATDLPRDLRLAAKPPHVLASARSFSRDTRSCRRARPACGTWPCRWSGNRRAWLARRPSRENADRARRLRHALDHQHAGKNRIAGKMPRNCGSFMVTFLMPTAASRRAFR